MTRLGRTAITTRTSRRPSSEYVAYYIEQNPVVKGFVGSLEQWDASSASCKDLVTDPWPLIYD
jgi:hypothetical protein